MYATPIDTGGVIIVVPKLIPMIVIDTFARQTSMAFPTAASGRHRSLRAPTFNGLPDRRVGAGSIPSRANLQ